MQLLCNTIIIIIIIIIILWGQCFENFIVIDHLFPLMHEEDDSCLQSDK